MADDKERTASVAGVASDVVGGLYSSPLLLALVALNAIGIASAVYFLMQLSDNNAKHLAAILDLQRAQFDSLIRLCQPRPTSSALVLPFPPRQDGP